MVKRLPREKVFRDPVHNYIHVGYQVILDLIDTKEFQRLRRIKQLGTTSLIFHGAEHTRFTHSLGVYELTRRICDNFARDYPSQTPGDGLWDDHERLVALCAALLHDIGHGPYSHTFEHIFHTDHEAWTARIITSPQPALTKLIIPPPMTASTCLMMPMIPPTMARASPRSKSWKPMGL